MAKGVHRACAQGSAMKAIKILTTVLILALSAGGAFADPKQDAEAKRLYEEGTKFYSLGDFPRAIEAYKKGFELKPDAVFLYNIAQAYRLSKKFEDALFFYKSFLRNLPGAVNRAEVEKRIEEMNAALQKQQETADSPPTGPVAPGTGGARTGTSTGDNSSGSTSGGEGKPAGGKPAGGEGKPAGGEATRPGIPSPGATAGASHAGEENRTPPSGQGDRDSDSGGGGSRPIYKKWWFWAGIGAVAVGTAAVIVATSGGGDTPDSHFGTFDVY